MSHRSRGRGHRREHEQWRQNGFEGWGGYMAAKMQKLEDQYEKDAIKGDNARIFKGIAIYVNGYTKPSSDELKRLVTSHGGKYEHYLYKTRVTHIIATNLPMSKVKNLMKTSKVVKPEWITDSVKAGRLLSYVPYLLYSEQGGRQKGMDSFTSVSAHQQSFVDVTKAKTTVVDPNSENMESETVTPTKGDNSMTVNHYYDSDDNSLLNMLYSSDEEEIPFNNTHLSEKQVQYHISENDEVKKKQSAPDLSASSQFKEVIKKTKISPGTESTVSEAYSNTRRETHHKSPAKSGDTNFLNEFYSNSRLHHLSTWKSEWRDYVNKLQRAGGEFTGRKYLEDFEKSSTSCSRLGTEGWTTRSRSGKPSKVVMHVDMDCFFVSVGLRKRPDLKGKPVAVTHSRGQGQKNSSPGSDLNLEMHLWHLKHRTNGGKKGKQPVSAQKQTSYIENLDEEESGIDDVVDQDMVDTEQLVTKESFHSMADIASCSYEARQAGVKNGMSMGRAKQLCPELKTIPYDFEGYQEVSKLLYDTVASYTHDIEAVSCDEMLVDCTDLLAVTGANPLDFATLLRQQIHDKTGCTASVGMGGNILLAKMATRKAKPNGQFYIESHQVLDFIKDQTVQNIPGVGWSMSRKLKSMNIVTCGDLQKSALSVLQKEFGPKTGQSLYKYARGQDDRPIKVEQERKSVSAEVNYGIRFQNDHDAEKFMLELSEEVQSRLKNIDKKGRSITLKVMVRRQDAPVETAKFMGHGICNNISKSIMLPIATDDAKIISRECLLLLRNMNVKAVDLRGVGIQITRLETSVLGPPGSKKGSQSILNFTVHKTSPVKSPLKTANSSTTPCNKSPNKTQVLIGTELSPTVNTIPPTGGSSTEVNDVIICDTEDQISNTEHEGTVSPIAEEEGDFLGGYCHNIVDQLSRRKTSKRFVPPLPTLPDLSGSPEFTDKMSSALTTDYFPSPSQIDPEVLQELPVHIREQIESEISNRKKPVGRPSNRNNIRTVSDDNQPGCSHFPDHSRETTMPSPSQIDPEVLQELPVHIRKQIENEISNRKKASTVGIQSDKGDHRAVRDNNQPGGSRLPDHSGDTIVPLPSPSQLDESCLNALPIELQREIRAAYADQGTNEKPHKLLQAQLVPSPPKLQSSPGKSPRRNKKKSPLFKVPRGKPGRGRPKKLDFQSSRQIQVREDTEPTIINIDTTPDNEVTPSNDTTHHTKPDISAVNLCGAVTISEVRALLRDWLQSTSDPETADEDAMVNYLTELAVDRNLEQVDLVIKFLHRHIQCLDKNGWTSALKRIINRMQESVTAIYGCKLKLFLT